MLNSNEILGSSYLSKQLIAYIGNKRRLLPLIQKAILECNENKSGEGLKFVDFFSGSGSVARLAKLSRFSVVANDWEKYSSLLNRAFIGIDAKQLPKMFNEFGGIDNLLSMLNALKKPRNENSYIGKYYSPKDTFNAKPDQERLFYTKENGDKIDAIREWIADKSAQLTNQEHDLLLALLVYEAATHSNTSGVFKAYHRGFGGGGRDALGRILAEVNLEYPQLVAGVGQVENMDALKLAEKLAAQGQVDIAYLDPPYNQHQYGSNYHLLNTIALNDKPQINRAVVIDGKKTDKGGIRKDWVKTKSDYCYRKSAVDSFSELISKIDAKRILVSYSTEGIIGFPMLLEILGKKGRLNIVVSEYTRYRGGKQSLNTTLKNLEFVLVVDTEQENRAVDTNRVNGLLNSMTMQMLVNQAVTPNAIINEGFSVELFTAIDKDLSFKKSISPGLEMRFILENFKKISTFELIKQTDLVEFSSLSGQEADKVLAVMKSVTSVTREEELSVTINSLFYHYEIGKFDLVIKELAKVTYLLKKFNNRKAYKSSLLYLIKVLDAVAIIKRDLVAKKSYEHFVTQLDKIIKLKLSIPIRERKESSRLQILRDEIKNSYKKIAL